MFDHISKLAIHFEKLAVSRLVTYHGTSAKNLPYIAQEGLKAFVPHDSPYIQKGVYLTNNIEAAARYATSRYGSEEYPVVLELMIASPRHVKKLTRDPLDDESEMYEQVEWGPWDEDVRYLESDIRKILGTGDYSHPIDIEPDIDKLNGLPIYRLILDYAKEHKMNVQQIKRKIQKKLPPGTDFGPFEISDSGTIKLTQQAYDSMHQMIYPKDLPAVTIKALWIPENVINPIYLPLAVNKSSFGSKLLAGEIANISNQFRDARVWNKEELPGAIEKIRTSDAVEHGYVDISELEEAAQNGDVDQFNNILDWIAFEEFNEFDKTVDEKTWLKFNLTDKLNVYNAMSLYKSSEPIQ